MTSRFPRLLAAALVVLTMSASPASASDDVPSPPTLTTPSPSAPPPTTPPGSPVSPDPASPTGVAAPRGGDDGCDDEDDCVNPTPAPQPQPAVPAPSPPAPGPAPDAQVPAGVTPVAPTGRKPQAPKRVTPARPINAQRLKQVHTAPVTPFRPVVGGHTTDTALASSVFPRGGVQAGGGGTAVEDGSRWGSVLAAGALVLLLTGAGAALSARRP